VLVGFAAETGDDDATAIEHARVKLTRKGCDLLVVNDVSGGAVFGADTNSAVILSADDGERTVAPGSKLALAHVIWDEVRGRLERREP
jgi:phosphopantothenoylcysteine decarboxylase/phosphopantothenate--cysteine ligase